MSSAVELPDTGSGRADLRQQVRRVSACYASPSGRIFGQLLAASVSDPEASTFFRTFFRTFFLAARRQAIATRWQRALDQGEVNPDIDVEVAQDILFGPLIFRLLSGHAPLTEELAGQVADAALHGLLAPGH